jgi:predicted dehydrogenase
MKSQPAFPRLNRRRFLATSALLAGAAPFGFAAPAGPPVRVGFLGTSYSHFAEKHKLLSQMPAFAVAGLCEEDAAEQARGPQSARWLTREKLFARTDLIVVESEVKDHARHAREALAAGKHVHVEKPPAASLADFQKLVELARERRRVLQVGYMWRYNPGINLALEAARSGWLGDVYLVRATMNTLANDDNRKKWAQFRGGAMFEQGCHLIDAVVRLLGKPVKVSPFLQHAGTQQDNLADNTVAVLEYPRAMAIVTSAPMQPNAGPRRFLEILGRNGTALVQPLEQPALTIDLEKAAGPYKQGKQEVELPKFERYVDEFAALAEAIRGGKQLSVPLDQELVIQETVLRACGMM